MRLIIPILYLAFFLFWNTAASQDIAIAPASSRYTTSLGLRKAFIGNNYREIWATPVMMPVFDINKEKGGLTITRLGGGAETKSLRMIDKDSIEWVLRTVDKNVAGVLPKSVRRTFIKTIIQDLISTAHPYAPLVVGPLAKALDLQAPEPTLFFVTDDTAFGQWRPLFANKVCQFEQVAPTKNHEFAITSDSMLYNLFEKPNEYSLDDTVLLKARLLDMLIGDWDRHKDQYKWGYTEKNGMVIYYPIVRDRDQAFFYSDGLLLMQVRLFALKFMTNFKKSDRKLCQLNNRSWSFDKILLSKLNENDWQRIIADFQLTLSDAVIETAVKKLPPEVYEKGGSEIFETLKARRNGLMKYGMKYYKFLAFNKKLNKTSTKEKLKKIMEAHPGKH